MINDVPEDEGELQHLAADLLYERDDPRATPWPHAAVLGSIRSRLRGIADSAVDGCIQGPEDPGELSATPATHELVTRHAGGTPDRPERDTPPSPARTDECGTGAKPVPHTERRADSWLT